jgi:hypothetical protein
MDCCEGETAFVPVDGDLKSNWFERFLSKYKWIKGRAKRHLEFAAMSPERRQATADMILKGIFRHLEDIERGVEDLEYIYEHFKITADDVYIATWIKTRGK